jgi:hypothetical protein
MSKLKNVIYFDPSGKGIPNPSVNPTKKDFVIKSFDTKLVLEAPVVGNIATKDQIDSIKEFGAEWINSRWKKFTMRKTAETCTVKETVKIDRDAKDNKLQVPCLTVTLDGGNMTDDQVHYVTGKVMDWLEKISTAPTAPAEKADEKKDEKKPDDKPAEKADEKKTPPAPVTPPADPPKDEKKPEKPADPPKDEKKDEKPADPPKDEKKPDDKPAEKAEDKKPAGDSSKHWNPDLSIDENIINIMGKED